MTKDVKQAAIDKHKELGGKLSVVAKGELSGMDDLSLYYTPGVAAVSSLVADDPSKTPEYTTTGNSVAVISDGSAVLGLGNIGPEGALPVMEGKAMIFNAFAGIDGFPVVLNVHTAEEIIAVCKAVAPSYGAINLEDIAAPICFEVEDRLKAELDIPVMHDDQHGTAVVVLAGLINALKLVGKSLNNSRIVVVGAGAAGTAVAKLLYTDSPEAEILMIDSRGIVSKDRDDLNPFKQSLLDFTNKNNESGSLKDAIAGADIFIGVSKPNLIDQSDVRTMAKDPIIFGLSNPNPEILPDEARAGGAAVVATGRSDFPNQINNALAFPGIFRGALDNKVKAITDEHKLAAAQAIAKLVENPSPDMIVPDVFDKRVVPEIAKMIV